MYHDFKRMESQTGLTVPAPCYEPDVSSALALLRHLPQQQLQEFLDRPEKLDLIIQTLPQYEEMKRNHEQIMVSNKSQAEFNLSLQPKLESLKQQVSQAYEEVNNLNVALAEAVAKLDSGTGNLSQDAMLAVFQTEAATADESSEEVADNFCDNKVDIDTFIKEYIPRRTESHLKRTKLEKLIDLFRQEGTRSYHMADPVNSYNKATNSVTTAYPQPSGYGAGVYAYGLNNQPYPATHYGGVMPSPYPQR